MGTVSGTLMGLATLTLGALGFTAANQDPISPAQSPNQRVSATMNDAPMDDVLEWLRRTGVNFVIDAGDPASRARLNVNVSNQPLKDVMDAIASAIGGEWVKHGDVYSLKSNRMGIPAIAPNMHDIPMLDEEHMKAFGEEFAPKIREHLRGLEKMGPEFEKHFEQFEMELPEMGGLAMPELPDMKLMLPHHESLDKLLKSLTPKQKELIKSKGHLTPEDLSAKQKELLKGLGGMRGSIRFHKDGEEFSMRGPGGEGMEGDVIIVPPPPMSPDVRIEGVPAPMAPDVRIEGVPAPGMSPDVRIEGVPAPPSPSRWKELNASITSAQRALIKRQGHLFVDQLTRAQRRMVNLPEGSSFTLTMKNGNESLTIKSRKQ